MQTIGFDALIAMGVFMSVTCAEDLRFVSEEDLRRPPFDTTVGRQPAPET